MTAAPLPLPPARATLLVRTDFTDQAAWDRLTEVVATPTDEDFLAVVEVLDDERFAGLAGTEAVARLSPDYRHPILILADAVTLGSTELPLLVVDLRDQPGRMLRIVATELWGIENNMSLANMYFYEFADNADGDGVFRGFS